MKKDQGSRTVTKPFLTGKPLDENTFRHSLLFCGSLLLVFLVSFLICSVTGFDNLILRIIINVLIITMAVIVFFNNGTNHGAEAVTLGEILYQKKQNGKAFNPSEQKICFHKAKGFLIGFFGTLPFLFLALFFACSVQMKMTGSGTLPSWMQAYTRRPDIGNALVQYLQPEGMGFLDYVRVVIRIALMPFVNLVGTDNSSGLLLLEKLSPAVLLIPAAAYGTGYLSGRSIRTKVHTAISEDRRKRVRKENKARKARRNSTAFREPEKLN